MTNTKIIDEHLKDKIDLAYAKIKTAIEELENLLTEEGLNPEIEVDIDITTDEAEITIDNYGIEFDYNRAREYEPEEEAEYDEESDTETVEDLINLF